MKESQGVENLVPDVPPGQVIPASPAVRAKVDELSSSVSPNLTPTAVAVAGCEAEHITMSLYDFPPEYSLEIIRILR